MVRYLFNAAPGPLWARVCGAAVVVVFIVAGLFLWGFPAVEPLLPFNGQAVG